MPIKRNAGKSIEQNSVEQNKDLVRTATERGLNQGDLSFVDDVFAPDYIVHTPGVELPSGPDAFRAAVGLWHTAFPDFHMDIEDMIGEGDLVALKFTTTGTHEGPLMGIPPTGRSFTVSGTDLHRAVGGRVVESWISDDVPRILMQLGVQGAPV